MSLVSSFRKWQELEQFSSNFSLRYELQFAPGKNIWSNYLQDNSYSVNILNNPMSIIFPTIQNYSVNIFNNSMSIIFQQFKTIQWIYSTIQCQLSSNNSGLFSEYIYSTIKCRLSLNNSVNIFNNPMSVIFNNSRLFSEYIQSPKYNAVYKIASILQARKK